MRISSRRSPADSMWSGCWSSTARPRSPSESRGGAGSRGWVAGARVAVGRGAAWPYRGVARHAGSRPRRLRPPGADPSPPRMVVRRVRSRRSEGCDRRGCADRTRCPDRRDCLGPDGRAGPVRPRGPRALRCAGQLVDLSDVAAPRRRGRGGLCQHRAARRPRLRVGPRVRTSPHRDGGPT